MRGRRCVTSSAGAARPSTSFQFAGEVVGANGSRVLLTDSPSLARSSSAAPSSSGCDGELGFEAVRLRGVGRWGSGGRGAAGLGILGKAGFACMHAFMHALAPGGHILGPGGVAGLGPWAPALGGLGLLCGLCITCFYFAIKKIKEGGRPSVAAHFPVLCLLMNSAPTQR